MNELIYIGAILGGLSGILRFIWKSMKAESWQELGKSKFMWLDEESDWWGYMFYLNHPIIALLSNVIIGSIIGMIVTLFL